VMLTETALVVVQLRTVEAPGLIAAGCAVRVRVVFGVGSVGDEEPPPQATSAARVNSAASTARIWLCRKRHSPYRPGAHFATP
jgi:hypothetical protein